MRFLSEQTKHQIITALQIQLLLFLISYHCLCVISQTKYYYY